MCRTRLSPYHCFALHWLQAGFYVDSRDNHQQLQRHILLAQQHQGRETPSPLAAVSPGGSSYGRAGLGHVPSPEPITAARCGVLRLVRSPKRVEWRCLYPELEWVPPYESLVPGGKEGNR